MVRAASGSVRLALGTLLAHAVLMVGAVVMVMPMLWMLATSFKPPTEIAIWPPVFLPQRADLRATTPARSRPRRSGASSSTAWHLARLPPPRSR